MPRTSIVLATSVSIALVPCGVAAAETVTTTFEPPTFHTGSVNGQGGWTSGPVAAFPVPPGCMTTGLPEYDQDVVKNSEFYSPAVIPGFGEQSLRVSNACGTGVFSDQTYSTPNKEPAGEEEANKEFIAQFSFITTTTAPQPGLDLSVSPTNFDGLRMSQVLLREMAGGIEVGISNCCEITPVALLERGVPYTIKLWMRFNPGPDNDYVRVAIDGKDVGQCFPSWENFYREIEKRPVPPTDRLIFRSVNEVSALRGKGYLFDNVSSTTANGPSPPTCEMPIEKQADVRTVRPGGRVGYRITVHNRGRLTARNYRVCDQIPRDMTFVSADRKLLAFGSRRCLVISSLAPGAQFSFHLVLHVNANAPPGTDENVADETPVEPPSLPQAPPGSLPPLATVPAVQQDEPSKTVPIAPVAEAKASVLVVAKRSARRPPAPPPVTG